MLDFFNKEHFGENITFEECAKIALRNGIKTLHRILGLIKRKIV